MMLRTALVLAKKDMKLFFRDKTALLLTLALPIVLATVFGSAMGGMMGGGGGGGGMARKVNLPVEDLDGTVASESFLALLEKSNGLEVVRVRGAERLVKNGDYSAAIVIPAGYGAQLADGQVPRIRLLRDPSAFITMQMIAGNLLPVLFESTVQNVGPNLMGKALDDLGFPESGKQEAKAVMGRTWEEMSALMTRLGADGALDEKPAETVEPEDAVAEDSGGGFNFLEDVPALMGLDTVDVVGQEEEAERSEFKKSGGASHAIAAMAVMMLMFSLVGAGGSLLEEHDGGTLLRLQLTPGAGGAIMAGKFLMLCACGAMQLVMLFAYGYFVFDMPILQHAFGLTIASMALLFASTGLGLFFATACTSRKQMEGLSTLVILVMSAVGGAWFPREMTPDWFQTAGLFTLTAYAMDAFHGLLWFGKGILPDGETNGIWFELMMLGVIGTVLNGLAYRLYDRRYVRQV